MEEEKERERVVECHVQVVVQVHILSIHCRMV